jgi:hypothetical protein
MPGLHALRSMLRGAPYAHTGGWTVHTPPRRLLVDLPHGCAFFSTLAQARPAQDPQGAKVLRNRGKGRDVGRSPWLESSGQPSQRPLSHATATACHGDFSPRVRMALLAAENTRLLDA